MIQMIRTGRGNFRDIADSQRIQAVQPADARNPFLCRTISTKRNREQRSLMKKLPKSLKIGNAKIICWSDSTIALTWIKVDPWRLAPFVKNRVMQVNELKLEGEWRHVPTHLTLSLPNL